ncbi:MAG: hypothetical protein MJZ92_05570 [Paludibacteraceae bacterium]|nr:hypothetical protein [Paludibacteraceae bacterium]
MKKILYVLLVALSATTLVSCKGEKGDPGMPGRDGKDGASIVKNVIINVEQKNWGYSNTDNNNYFFATVDMPEITEKIFDGGIIKMYRVWNYETKDAIQTEMPYTRQYEVLPDGSSAWYFYTEHIDYDFGIGKMTIYYSVSDFDYELDETFVPEAMQFRCVIMY